MRFKELRQVCVTLRPPAEPSSREALLTQPKSLAVVDQYFYRCPFPVAENKDTAAERITFELLAAYLGEPINALSKIGRLYGDQNAHLWGDLDHASPLQKLRLRVARSGTSAPLRWIRIFAPPASSSSTMHSGEEDNLDGRSSTNDEIGFSPEVPSEEGASRRFFNE